MSVKVTSKRGFAVQCQRVLQALAVEERRALVDAILSDIGVPEGTAEWVHPALAHLQALRASGYMLHLYYLWAESSDLLIPRIQQRVMAGGHHVPDLDVRRRYERSLNNIAEYASLMHKIRVFDNSGSTPVLVYEKNGDVRVYDKKRMHLMGGGWDK